MDTTTPPNPNPNPETVDTTRDALFKALRLKAADAPPVVQSNNSPVPDSGNGVEVPTTGINRSTLSELVTELSKNPVTPPVAEVVPPVVPPIVVPPIVPPVVVPPVEDANKLREELRKKLTMPEVQPATATPAPAPSTLNLDLTGLDADEVDAVKLAHFAETQNPSRYAGHASRTLDHIKQIRAYRLQKQIEDPSIEFDEDNDEYQSMLRRMPKYERGERERMERKRLSEEIRNETLQEVAVSQRKLEQELRAVKAAPVVEKTVKSFTDYLDAELPIRSDDTLESDTAKHIKNLAEGAAREFMLISTNLKPYDGGDETHKWLGKFIQEQGEVLQKSDSPLKTRGDKTFVPRAAFNSMPEKERAKHFTFTDPEVLELVAINAKLACDQIVQTERAKFEKFGYAKAPKSAPTPPPTAPIATPPPVVTPNGVVDISPRGGVAPVSTPTTVNTNLPTDPFQRMLMNKLAVK